MDEAKKAQVATLKQRHGEDFFKRIGALGGYKKTDKTKNRGFAVHRELARTAGKKGGSISRRTA